MTSETGNQLIQSPQSSESSTVRGNVVLAYPAQSLDIADNIPGKRPVKGNKADNIDQLRGYLA